MKLSQLIKLQQALLAEHGDHDVLDRDEYRIVGVTVETVTPGQAEFWGDPSFAGQKYYNMKSDR